MYTAANDSPTKTVHIMSKLNLKTFPSVISQQNPRFDKIAELHICPQRRKFARTTEALRYECLSIDEFLRAYLEKYSLAR
jgi:hypothetical protein